MHTVCIVTEQSSTLPHRFGFVAVPTCSQTWRTIPRVTASDQFTAPDGADGIGPRIRSARQSRGLSVRELAKRVGCSPSNISAIERGITRPSISSLTAVVTQLGITMESLFGDDDAISPSSPGPEGHAAAAQPTEQHGRRTAPPRHGIMRRDGRPQIRIESGVVSESLLPSHEDDVDFCIYSYDPGGASVADAQVIRHPGREYGLVLEGTLRVQIGFEEFTLETGDSIAFASTTPHRFWNDTDQVTRVVWFSGASL